MNEQLNFFIKMYCVLEKTKNSWVYPLRMETSDGFTLKNFILFKNGHIKTSAVYYEKKNLKDI